MMLWPQTMEKLLSICQAKAQRDVAQACGFKLP